MGDVAPGLRHVEMYRTDPCWWWPFGSVYVTGHDGLSKVVWRRRMVPWWRYQRQWRRMWKFAIDWARGSHHG